MEDTDVVQLMAVWSAYWPQANLGPDSQVALQAWGRLLTDVTPEAAFAAVEQIAAEGERFAPPVGLIRKRAVDLAARATGTAVLDVDEAWALVSERVRTVGWYGGFPEDLPEPARSVVRSLGWDRVCHDESPGVLLAQFRDLYAKAQPREERELVITPAGRELLADLRGRLEGRRRELEA